MVVIEIKGQTPNNNYSDLEHFSVESGAYDYAETISWNAILASSVNNGLIKDMFKEYYNEIVKEWRMMLFSDSLEQAEEFRKLLFENDDVKKIVETVEKTGVVVTVDVRTCHPTTANGALKIINAV
jgi:hypothetical protein